MTAEQFRAVAGKKRLSKDDEERIAKGLVPIELEDRVQERVAVLLRNLSDIGKVVFFSSIPNSTFTKFKGVTAKNKRLGLNPGMPDLIIISKDSRNVRKILFLELKREKGGSLKKEQKFVIDALNSVSGSVIAKRANGYAEAKSAILEVCGLPDFREE